MKRILIFLLPIIIFAQTITKIEYKGLIHISPITASTITQITPNSQFDIEKIDKAVKNLYKTGYFEEIKADFSNGVLTFICKEKPTIANIKLINVSE
ncbi:POTRA domain-containing protein, partial [Caminibacter pacificus]